MLKRDWPIAIVAALVLMALGVAVTVAWVAIYSHLIDPGHPVQVYQAYADRNAPWIGIYTGLPMWFLAGGFVARTRSRHRAVDTAFGIGFVYALLDLTILAAIGALPTIIGLALLSYTTKTFAAVIGARIFARAT